MVAFIHFFMNTFWSTNLVLLLGEVLVFPIKRVTREMEC